MPLICTPLQETTQKATQKRLKALKGKVDLAEIWLDHITDLNLKTLFKSKPLPVVVVCKKPNEFGRFKGLWQALAQVLTMAGQLGADYVDVPLQMPEKLSKKIVQEVKKTTKIIVSFHDFKKTPSPTALYQKALKMKKRGAHIVKIATYCKTRQDAINLILLAHQLQDAKIPHIIIGMGPLGQLTRILTPTLGGAFMFAPLVKSKSTAPGQLTVRELKNAWNLIGY